MARNMKTGLDYFPLDTDFDSDLELYLLEHEAVGLAVWIALLQIIYRNKGYYIEYNKDLALLIKRKINVDINAINVCINALIERNILDKGVFEAHGVLTSRGIQKRFLEAIKRRKQIDLIKEYLLIDPKKYVNPENVNIYSINVNINAQNVDINTTKKRKEKERKEKERERKENYTENSHGEFSPPIDPHALFLIFNEENRFLPQARLFSQTRRENAIAFMSQHCRSPDDVPRFLEDFRRAVQLCQEIPFLRGKNPREWKATFDWLIEGDNYLRVLEGNYGDPEVDEEERWERFWQELEAEEKQEQVNDGQRV